MKVAGSSRKDGMTLYGEKYAVTFSYNKKLGEYTYGLYRREDRERQEKIKKMPVLRGLYGLWCNSGIKAVAVTSLAAVVGEAMLNCQKKGVRRLGVGLILAQYGFLGMSLYKIFGTGGDVRCFHGAEHKVINAYTLKQEPINGEEAQRASRISRRCGTNYLVYMTATGLAMGWLPLGHGLAQQILQMGVAYELFQMPVEKCPSVKSAINIMGDALQRRWMTKEPESGQLEAATKAMNLLLAAERDELEEQEKQAYMENARNRSWMDRMVG